jgi:hypothetical protein
VANVKAIQAFDWRDAKKQGYAQFANTFVVLEFGSESDLEGDKVKAFEYGRDQLDAAWGRGDNAAIAHWANILGGC